MRMDGFVIKTSDKFLCCLCYTLNKCEQTIYSLNSPVSKLPNSKLKIIFG